MTPYALYLLTKTRAVSRPPGIASESSNFTYKVVETIEAVAQWIVRRYKRHVSIGELYRLNDHLLRDIGMSRHEIPSLVDAMLDSPKIKPIAPPRATAVRRAPQAELPVADNDNSQRQFSAKI